jgi:hypothetical protein
LQETIVKKAFRFVVYTVVVSLFLIAILLGMTQTAIFKEWIRQYAEDEAAKYLNGELTVGKISGTLVTGLTLHDVIWRYDDERAIYLRSLNVDINPIGFLHREIHIQNLVLMNPSVDMKKSADGVLNLSQLVRKRERSGDEIPDSAAPVPAEPWTYRLDNLEILGGEFRYRNMAADAKPVRAYPVAFPKLDYRDIHLENLYITMSVLSDGRNHSLDIRSLNFSVNDPSFSVSHLSLDAVFSPQRTQINRLRLITDRTNVNVTGGIADFNLLGKNEGPIEEKEMTVSLYADRFHFDDLKMFIPAVWFLEGDARVDMEANGTLNEVAIEHAVVSLGRTNLDLTGTLAHVTEGSELFIDASFSDSRIDPAEVVLLLPHYPIPDYGHIGVMDVSARFVGKPRDFTATLDLFTSVGLYSGELDLDLTGPLLVYDGSVVTRNAKIESLLDQRGLPDDLSGIVRLRGEGTKLGDLLTDAELAIDHMSVGGIAFDDLYATARAREHAVTLTASGFMEQSTFTLDAYSNITDVRDAPFDLRLTMNSLDMSRILKDTSYVSNLTFTLAANGTGLTPQSFLGEAAIQLEPSSFRGYEFRGEPLYVSLEEIDNGFREMNVRSEIVDLYLAGEFDLPTITGIAYDHLRQLVGTIREDIEGIVTGTAAEVGEYVSAIEITTPLDTVYDIDFKNLDPIAIFLGRDSYHLEIAGKVYGYFRAVDSMLRLGGDIEVEHFLFLSDEQRILIDRVRGKYNIDNDFGTRGLYGIFSEFAIGADGVYTPTLVVTDAEVRGDLRGTEWNISSKAVIDTTVAIEIDVMNRFEATALESSITHVNLKYGEFDFENRDTLALRYNRDGLWIESFSLYHNTQSTIDVSGLYARDNHHFIDFALQNIDLGDLHRLAIPEAVGMRQPIFEGNIDLVGGIGGRTDSLYGNFDVRVYDVEYAGLSFGMMNGTVEFGRGTLRLRADVADAENSDRTVFSLSGQMPFEPFPMNGGDRIPNGPVDMHIFSEGFDLSIIDAFVRDLRNFRGSMTSDVSITGTIEDPLYGGTLEVVNGQFLFSPTNVMYEFSGRLEPRQNELLISSLELRNRRRDLPDGRMNFSGSIQTRGLTINTFNVQANGQLMVLRTAARRPGDAFYGDLVIATGGSGLRLAGSLEESSLTGNVLIRSANLTFPPARTTAYDRTGSIVNYIAIEDLGEDDEGLTPLETFYRDLARAQRNGTRTEQPGRSFIDGLDYDVVVQTDGRVELTMVFNQTTGEELVARIETSSLRMYRDELTGLRLIGAVEIVDPSAYSFYRRFEARGRLTFVGPPDNPELGITATYTGQRVPVQTASMDPSAEAQTTAGTPEQVVVQLDITGDRYEPKLGIKLLVNNEAWEGDVETDAISFILTGRFQSELDSGDYRTISADFGRGIPATFMSGVATTLLSNVFSEFLRNEVRFIRTAEIVWYGGNIMETAELRISGELRNFYWTIGGRVFNDIGNTNFSFQIPMGPVFNSDRWTNLFLELERRSQRIEYSEDPRPVNAARLYYSISF